MTISKGSYEIQPHITKQLLDFQDENLTTKQVQQFFGIINYMAKFIPNLATIIKPLHHMLKKDAPQWSLEQTIIVHKIKQLAQHLAPLQIPFAGRKILETDVNDHYQTAILLEEQQDKIKKICGYKSGSFSKSEVYYHSIFKEILMSKGELKIFNFISLAIISILK